MKNMQQIRKMTVWALLPLLVIVFISFRNWNNTAAETADKIFINGRLLTMDSSNTIKQAIALKDGKILAVGTTGEMDAFKGNATEVIDLKGQTMIPGLIDGHSHFMSLNRGSSANIASPPVGTITSIPGLVAELQRFAKEKGIEKGEWVSAGGYDPDQLVEKRHPTKEDLDGAFPDNPVILSHASGHMSVVNSAALKLSGVTAATPDPPGGQIVRMPGTGEPTGLLLERARSVLKMRSRSKPDLEEQLKLLEDQQTYYASFGITTAQDGSTSFESVRLLSKAASMKKLFIDIEALPSYSIIDSLIGNPAYQFGVLDNHLKLEGFKLIADGSPQGKTAFLTKSYLTPVPGCDHDCTGIPTVTQDQFNDAIQKGFKNNIQTFVHCNGDATVDMYVKAIEKACASLGTSSSFRRPVVIHSQFVRPDQLDKYKELGMVPAFFTNHAFFWGDTHVANLGKERAYFLSPVKTSMRKNIVFTNHTDYGVTPLNQMFLLWTSVARKSRSGLVVGAAECLTPMEGLRAITINGAYQYFEEKIKGSLEKGKLADLVILSADPTSVEPEKIKDIAVLETIKEGKTIYKKTN